MGRAPHHGWGHRQVRTWYVRRYRPGVTTCALGGEILTQPANLLDLAHDDRDPSGRTYLGLACRRHNRGSSRQSPRRKLPHNWSNAYKIMKRASANVSDDRGDREAERRGRLGDRERRRLERLRRRTIIVPDSDK